MLIGFLAPVSTVAVFAVIVKAMVAPVLAIEPTVNVLAMAVPDLSLAMVVLIIVVAVAMALSWHAAMLTPAVVFGNCCRGNGQIRRHFINHGAAQCALLC